MSKTVTIIYTDIRVKVGKEWISFPFEPIPLTVIEGTGTRKHIHEFLKVHLPLVMSLSSDFDYSHHVSQ
jgi:hypothetical protein